MRSTSWRARLMSPTASIVIDSPAVADGPGVASIVEAPAVAVIVGVASVIVGASRRDAGASGAPAFDAQATARSVQATSDKRSSERRRKVMITRVSYAVRARAIGSSRNARL